MISSKKRQMIVEEEKMSMNGCSDFVVVVGSGDLNALDNDADQNCGLLKNYLPRQRVMFFHYDLIAYGDFASAAEILGVRIAVAGVLAGAFFEHPAEMISELRVVVLAVAMICNVQIAVPDAATVFDVHIFAVDVLVRATILAARVAAAADTMIFDPDIAVADAVTTNVPHICVPRHYTHTQAVDRQVISQPCRDVLANLVPWAVLQPLVMACEDYYWKTLVISGHSPQRV